MTTRAKAKNESVDQGSPSRQHPGADDSAGPNPDDNYGRRSIRSGNDISPGVSDISSQPFQYRPIRSTNRARIKGVTLPQLKDSDNIILENVEYRTDASERTEIHGDVDAAPIIGGGVVSPQPLPDIGGSKCGLDIVLGKEDSYASQHYESSAFHTEISTLGTFPVKALSRLQIQFFKSGTNRQICCKT